MKLLRKDISTSWRVSSPFSFPKSLWRDFYLIRHPHGKKISMFKSSSVDIFRYGSPLPSLIEMLYNLYPIFMYHIKDIIIKSYIRGTLFFSYSCLSFIKYSFMISHLNIQIRAMVIRSNVFNNINNN